MDKMDRSVHHYCLHKPTTEGSMMMYSVCVLIGLRDPTSFAI